MPFRIIVVKTENIRYNQKKIQNIWGKIMQTSANIWINLNIENCSFVELAKYILPSVNLKYVLLKERSQM